VLSPPDPIVPLLFWSPPNKFRLNKSFAAPEAELAAVVCEFAFPFEGADVIPPLTPSTDGVAKRSLLIELDVADGADVIPLLIPKAEGAADPSPLPLPDD